MTVRFPYVNGVSLHEVDEKDEKRQSGGIAKVSPISHYVGHSTKNVELTLDFVIAKTDY